MLPARDQGRPGPSFGRRGRSERRRRVRFTYDEPDPVLEPQKHPQLERVTDPRGGQTRFEYYEDTALADIPSRRVFLITNRRGNARTFSYDGDQQDHSGSTTATVADARGGSWDCALDLRDRSATGARR